MSLLEVKNLHTKFITKRGLVKAVDGISFTLNEGETLALVGESGSGKSVTALSILGLLEEGCCNLEGEILYKGQNLLGYSEPSMRKIRGKEISMIFQEPMSSLNPVFKVGHQIEEILLVHEKLSKKASQAKAVDMLHMAGFPDPAEAALRFPHELSGGMRQRVMIAIALACRPKILIADEPTTALDVTIQAQILSLIKDLQKDLGTALLLITHDLGVVAETADRAAVMYCGKIVEECTVERLLTHGAKHPYTAALMESARDMKPINGMVPPPFTDIRGCAFAPRCAYTQASCQEEKPPFNKGCACFYPLKGGQ